jgi:hypothetical protein
VPAIEIVLGCSSPEPSRVISEKLTCSAERFGGSIRKNIRGGEMRNWLQWACSFALVVLTSCSSQSGGTAKATVTLDGNTYTYTGGSCIHNAGGLVVNIGVLPSEAPTGTYPDYFGASIPTVPGHFEEAVVTFNKDGKNHSLGKASGEATTSSAQFSGNVMMHPTAASGSFSC